VGQRRRRSDRHRLTPLPLAQTPEAYALNERYADNVVKIVIDVTPA
jgi:hypothetical protein